MKIQVEMTAEEFQEFMSWRADRGRYDREIEQVRRKPEFICRKVLLSLDQDPKRPGKVKIIDQEHAAELVDMATDWFS